MSVPLPEAYGATLSNPLTFRASLGAAPEYETSPSKTTDMLTARPTPYAPSGAETFATRASEPCA